MGFRNWILVVFAIAAVLFFVTRSRRQNVPIAAVETDPGTSQTTASASPALPQAPKPLMKLYAASRPKLTKEEKSSTELTPGCARAWDGLREQDFATDTSLSKLNGDVLTGCEAPPSALKGVHEQFVEACKAFHDGKNDEKARLECMLSGLQYRGMIAEWIHRDQKISSIDDVRTLSDLLLSKLYANEKSGIAPEQALRGQIEVAERMMEVDPSLPLDNLVVGARVVDYMQSLDKNEPSGPRQAATLAAIDRALERNPQSNRLVSAKIWIESEGLAIEKLHDVTERARIQHPTAAPPLYYSALADSAQGNLEAAEQKLREGREIFPDDPHFREPADKMQPDINFSQDMKGFLPGSDLNAIAE